MRMRFLVTPTNSASRGSAFNFQDGFWQVSSMCLLNFNLQLKFMPNSFSLGELYMWELPILRVLGS